MPELEAEIYQAIRYYTAAHGDDEVFVAELIALFNKWRLEA